MKIKFLKDYRYPGGGYSNKGDVQTFEDAEFAKWAIDNGFAEEVKESGWWKPKNGEEYYFTDDSGCVKQDTWRNSFWQVDRYRTGNVFKTEEAGNRHWDYLKAIATVRQDEGVIDLQGIGEEYELNDNKYDDFSVYTVAFDLYLRKLVVTDADEYISANAIWFDTEEHAQASLDKHPDEWKIIANYDWSKGEDEEDED